MFNVMSCLSEPRSLLEAIAARNDGSAVAIRQGASLRFGPLPPEQYVAIEQELQGNIAQCSSFSVDDMDRTYADLINASFARGEIGFELFQR